MLLSKERINKLKCVFSSEEGALNLLGLLLLFYIILFVSRICYLNIHPAYLKFVAYVITFAMFITADL
jgi:hypothetical protein